MKLKECWEVILMIGKDKIFQNLDFIESMNQFGASPNLDEYWDEIVGILSKDIEATRNFLNNDCNEYQIRHIGSYFEDISYKLKSYDFISILEELQKKYPDIDMREYIKWVKYAIED